jgi:hypothetical protein
LVLFGFALTAALGALTGVLASAVVVEVLYLNPGRAVRESFVAPGSVICLLLI